jgi:hypothetical protein
VVAINDHRFQETTVNTLSLLAIVAFIALFVIIIATQTVVLSRLRKYHSSKPEVAGMSFNPIVGSFSQSAALFKFLWYGRYKALSDKTLVIECNMLRSFYVLYGCSMVMIILTRW